MYQKLNVIKNDVWFKTCNKLCNRTYCDRVGRCICTKTECMCLEK